MVAGAATADAVERARRLPSLRVGLHLVLVEGRPAMPAENIPDLLDASGQLRTDLTQFGFDICARPSVRAQLKAEIEAQFRAYQQTGLALDHVNGHKHFHLHPAVASEVIAIGRRYGMHALRIPREPATVLAQIEPGTRGPISERFLARLLSLRARRAGLHAPDQVFGLAWSGAMSALRVAGLLRHLGSGATEIYLHPATRDEFSGSTPGYRYADELAALIDPDVCALARRPDVTLAGYGDC
jgi:hopanoid biosynthesis associated protein HpnK